MMKIQTPVYVISVMLALSVGSLAAWMTQDSMAIYAEIAEPPLSPPAYWFPPVWTLLYFFMGLSAARVWLSETPEKARNRKLGLAFYGLSLFVNFTWCIIFFNYRAFGAAFVWLLLLLGLIVATIFQYRKVCPVAAYLQIPYALWVTFAGYLTLGIWVLN